MTSPAFLNICAWSRGFNIFKKTAWGKAHAYTGMVVASPDAFYIVIDPKTLTGVGAAIGGALGGAIEGLLANKKTHGKKKYMPQDVPFVEEMDLSDLPTEVTEHPEWPVTWEEGPVIVVPRKAVQSLRTAWWMGGIKAAMEGVAIQTATPIFQRKKMAAYLVDMGWEVAGL
jgi:hypothetical protein